ncbi:RCC1 domain-containing protein [Salinispora arenicola]|uniref:RCC1 domain-containing protein n=1 Tax=Salinispora arenicola TaxID=168697 RepID=UPI0016B2A170|nr:Ig-like domain repeat protein [Salinispora arenicola]NIL57949.1 chromosome condensation regulator RCC1 [Salinispora arenicola]NIL63605.1 chromosome condensation regulator RCC1 [Salinispora arenicola]
MERLCRRAGRGAGQGSRAITGWFFVVLAAVVTQAVAVWPAAAQNAPSPSGVASDTVLTWGENDFGQLGDGTTIDSSTPVDVDLPAGTTITAIAGSDANSFALTSTGAVLAWGNNTGGELGDGTNTDRTTPVAVKLPTGTTVTAIAVGTFHTLALTSTGALLAWGGNGFGELGDGTTTARNEPVPVNVPAGTTITAIAGGRGHSLALTSTGTVLAWGNNSSGQLGDGTTTDSTTPVDVNLPPDTTITAITAHDGSHSLALTSTGTILAWGLNSSGELGDGTTTNRSTPVDVNLPPGTTVTAIDNGDDHSMALTAPPTSTTLRVTPPNPTADQPVTLTAAVTCNVDAPTGTITFRTNTTTLATAPLTSSGTATHVTALPAGTHTLTAGYTSTNTCPNSQSPPTTITIAPPPDEPDLPITGPNMTTTGAAALSILAGATLIYAARRRRPPHHPK